MDRSYKLLNVSFFTKADSRGMVGKTIKTEEVGTLGVLGVRDR
jgi:hypothetical protein